MLPSERIAELAEKVADERTKLVFQDNTAEFIAKITAMEPDEIRTKFRGEEKTLILAILLYLDERDGGVTYYDAPTNAEQADQKEGHL